ncbi:MAG TPA: hypothetical protein VL128_12990 [Candidatus Eisenbacteria bacterium]|nr:hypothetical protein [Candidatus Eisenbacteria bacterium]
MREKSEIGTAACSDYEDLLRICKSALLAWSVRREEIVRFGQRARSATDALQKLQADYARAYSRLERHVKSCTVCRFTNQVGGASKSGAISISTRKEMSA